MNKKDFAYELRRIAQEIESGDVENYENPYISFRVDKEEGEKVPELGELEDEYENTMLGTIFLD